MVRPRFLEFLRVFKGAMPVCLCEVRGYGLSAGHGCVLMVFVGGQVMGVFCKGVWVMGALAMQVVIGWLGGTAAR